MGTRARGFILFSFAFSSVLSSPEIPLTPNGKRTPLTPSGLESSASNASINAAVNRECFKGGKCSGFESIEKREISPAGRERELNDVSETERGYPYTEDVRMSDGIEKRARVGFTGMRGKKDSYLSRNYLDKGTPPGEDDLETFLDVLEKRARVGFNGMRGKKYDVSEKRGQMSAFHGMRGKRLDDEYDGYRDTVGVLYGLLPWYDMQDEEFSDEGVPAPDKRAMAFHGMRGRKSEGDSAYVKKFPFSSYEMMKKKNGFGFKRTMGFLGMRGKKTPESWRRDDYGKRGSQSGFFGMKGKKAQSGFFGMRGKKSLSDSFGANESEPGFVTSLE